MKKGVFFILMFIGLASYAQTAQSTTIQYNKNSVPGVSIAIAGYEFDFIQSALINRLEKVGKLKGSNSKGFRVYESQNFPEFGNLSYTIFTQTIKGTKKSPAVTLNILVSTGNNNFVSPASDPELTQKMKDFLTDFVVFLKEYDKKLKIETLTSSIAKFEKEYTTLTADKDKLQKEISNLEKRLKDKENEISSKESELQKAKTELEGLKNN